LGTPPGRRLPAYGDRFAEVINVADRASRSSRATPREQREHSAAGRGGLDIALSLANPLTRPSPHRAAAHRLKILTAMYSSPGMFVVRADSPYKSIRDLIGQRVAFGAKGSGLPICRITCSMVSR